MATPDSIAPASLVPAVEEIARRAGAEIMEYYSGRKRADVEIKNDGSEVTAADLASDAVIFDALRKLTPDIPIVSEERVAKGDLPDVSGGTFWTVDPLDGTKEFINRTGAFVVAISLVVEGKVSLGAIYHPAMHLMYSGAGPGTASKVDETGKRTPLGGEGRRGGGELRVLVNEPHADMNRVKGYLSAQFGDAARVDAKSGILRACQVAEGLADAAVYVSPKREGRSWWWDVAPGHAIIEAAGGTVKTLDGKPVLYTDKDYLAPPHAAQRAGIQPAP